MGEFVALLLFIVLLIWLFQNPLVLLAIVLSFIFVVIVFKALDSQKQSKLAQEREDKKRQLNAAQSELVEEEKKISVEEKKIMNLYHLIE